MGGEVGSNLRVSAIARDFVSIGMGRIYEDLPGSMYAT
jgi:hypothetical protein